ncbi:MAG TPA: DNA-3-methyladenine glycosylase, partial [Ignavibacteriaceae bacterium]
MKKNLIQGKLESGFYCRNVLKVASDLLGKILVRVELNKIYATKIVEVEAYDGKTDQAAHS